MATTNFVSGTLIESTWLNDVDAGIYETLPPVVVESATTTAGLAAHIAETTAAHAASAITNTPAGNIAATTVQAALNELDSEKQPLDATLTALAGTLTAANKIPYATALNTAGELDFLDEDTMVSNSATAVPSQQSVKAYVDGFGGTSGTWTPTLVIGANATVATVPSATSCYYQRIGSVITVSGTLTITVTAANTITTIYFTLPVASAFTSSEQMSGAVGHTLGGGIYTSGFITADPADDRGQLGFTTGTTGAQTIRFTGQYLVL